LGIKIKEKKEKNNSMQQTIIALEFFLDTFVFLIIKEWILQH